MQGRMMTDRTPVLLEMTPFLGKGVTHVLEFYERVCSSQPIERCQTENLGRPKTFVLASEGTAPEEKCHTCGQVYEIVIFDLSSQSYRSRSQRPQVCIWTLRAMTSMPRAYGQHHLGRATKGQP